MEDEAAAPVWLYVSNLPPSTPSIGFLSEVNGYLEQEAHLQGRSSCHALDCRTSKKARKGGGRSQRGYLFLTFATSQEAQWAMTTLSEGFVYRGRKVRAHLAKDKGGGAAPALPLSTPSSTNDDEARNAMASDDTSKEGEEHSPRSSRGNANNRSISELTTASSYEDCAGHNANNTSNNDPLAVFQSAFAKFVVESEKKDKINLREIASLRKEIEMLHVALHNMDLELREERKKGQRPSADNENTLNNIRTENRRLETDLNKVRSELADSEKKREVAAKEMERVKSTVKGQDRKIGELVRQSSELVRAGMALRKAGEEKDQQMAELKRQISTFQSKGTRAESDAVQLKYLLQNSEAEVQHLKAKLENANKRVDMAKQDYMNANDKVVAEKIKREAAERKLQKKLLEIKEAKKKEQAKQEPQKKVIAAKPVEGISVISPKANPSPSVPSPIQDASKGRIGSFDSTSLARETQIASLINFEADYRKKQAAGDGQVVTKEEAEERRQAELEMVESSFSTDEVHIKRRDSSTATITRRLGLIVEDGTIHVDLEIKTTDEYLYKSEYKVAINASIPPPSPTSNAPPEGTAMERTTAQQSLPKLLASCRWETEITKGEESIFGVLVAADTWAQNEWPSLLEKCSLDRNDSDNVASEQDSEGKQSVPYNFGRVLIYSHHIYDPDKLKQVIKIASIYHLGGIVKTGTPGFVLVEGLDENCQSYADDLLQFRTKMWEMRQSGRRDSATFSVIDKASYKVQGSEALDKMKVLPEKMKEIENDQLDELKLACSKIGFDAVLEEHLKLK